MCIFFTNAFAQDSLSPSRDSVAVTPQTTKFSYSTRSIQQIPPNSMYSIKWKTDAPVIAGGLGLSAYGLYLVQNKDDLTEEELKGKSKDDIPFFDRGNVGYYSEKANDASYIPFFASFAMPLTMMIADKDQRQQAGKIIVMYTESLAITSAMFTICAGAIDRSRPLVYGGDEVPLDKKLSKNSQRSFYAGHTAATASASFFAAKVYSDLHPDSKFRTYLWIISAALPAVTAYYRYEAGQHFLSDNILGYALGAASGILVPELHKNKNFERVTIYPAVWPNAKGLGVTYSFCPLLQAILKKRPCCIAWSFLNHYNVYG